MKVLELFAGSRSFSKVAEEMGMETFTTDFKPFDKIDYVVDILDFDVSKLPFKPDVIWASPPCTYFSVASIGHHWNKDHTPKTEQAKLGVKIVQKTLDIINFLKPDYFFIENPRGKLRRLEVVKDIPKTTVSYCQYGDTRLKPSDIWSNFIFEEHSLLSEDNKLQGWNPRPMCNYRQKNCKCHHEKAPRGSKTGTQGLKNNYERSKVPYELCKEILKGVK